MRVLRPWLVAAQLGAAGAHFARGDYIRSTTTKEDVIGSFDGTTRRFAHLEIIGMMGIVLPQAPAPDHRLALRSDADFGDTGQPTPANEIFSTRLWQSYLRSVLRDREFDMEVSMPPFALALVAVAVAGCALVMRIFGWIS